MFLNKQKIWAILACLCLFSFAACDDDNNMSEGAYSNGIFITNEGPFQTGTGTLSFFDNNTQTINNAVFQLENNRPLGNIVQSLGRARDKGYVVVNNANKVEVVNLDSLTSLGTITGFTLPRYFLAVGDKGFVSQWGEGGVNGSVAVVNLNNLTITNTIATGSGAERMAVANDKLYVVNGGGFGSDNTVTVINPETEVVITNIQVGDNPNSLQVDRDGNLWVLCGGFVDFVDSSNNTEGQLLRINTQTEGVDLSLTFPDATSQPQGLLIDKAGDFLYYRYMQKVFKQEIGAANLATDAFIQQNYYGMGIDWETADLWGADAGDFVSNGWIYRHDSENGAVIDSFQVGIIPNNFYF